MTDEEWDEIMALVEAYHDEEFQRQLEDPVYRSPDRVD
jgi:hypothetical protein